MNHSSSTAQSASEAKWYAVSTRSRQEKSAAAMLDAIEVQHFLPLSSELHQWSDRKQTVHIPLFPGYVFVHLDLSKDRKLSVLKVPGIVTFVGNQTGPLPIPENQIEDIRTVLTESIPCCEAPYLREGDRVRVVRGPLKGMEGTFVRTGSSAQLIISIDMIQRSLAVGISGQDVEPVVSDLALRSDIPEAVMSVASRI